MEHCHTPLIEVVDSRIHIATGTFVLAVRTINDGQLFRKLLLIITLKLPS
jgi:hypothetical protein